MGMNTNHLEGSNDLGWRIVLFGLLCMAAFGLSVGGPRLARSLHLQQTWSQVPGEITVSRGIEVGKSKQGSPLLVLELEYRYEVAGKEYRSRRFYPDQVVPKSGRIHFGGSEQSALYRYPEGARITVFHDPEDPAEALVEVEVDLLTKVMVGGSLVLLLLLMAGIYLARLLRDRSRRVRAEEARAPLPTPH